MRQQSSKKAILISATLTAFILLAVVSTFFAQKGWSLALANPLQIQAPQIQASGIADETAANMENIQMKDIQMVSDQPAADQMTTLDPALEAALDTALDPNMDPALKASLKSALRSALAPQTFPALTSQGKQPPIVVTVEPIVIPGQQQIADSSGQWNGQTGAASVSTALVSGSPVTAAPSSGPSVDQVAAAYKAQLEEAYAALQNAYDQIGSMQTNQSAPAATNISYSGEHEGDEHEGREHEGGEHEGGEHEGGEHEGGEHGDD